MAGDMKRYCKSWPWNLTSRFGREQLGRGSHSITMVFVP
jgi:hypothetical protein